MIVMSAAEHPVSVPSKLSATRATSGSPDFFSGVANGSDSPLPRLLSQSPITSGSGSPRLCTSMFTRPSRA